MPPTLPAIHAHWIEADLRLAGLLDSRMIALLRAIDATGSINQAAKQQGLSYKGAWQIIERANNGAPQVLINTAVGGSKGGGTRLTDAGRKLLALFTELESRHQNFIAELNRELATQADTVLLLQRLTIKCSSRNQLFGKVTALNIGAVNAEVTVTLKNHSEIVASVDLDSLHSLQLAEGVEAILLIDGNSIVLSRIDESRQLSARNQLEGQVLRIAEDGVGAEIIVALAGGECLSAAITRDSLQRLAIAEGQTIRTIFKPSAVIIGRLDQPAQ